jgi:hypothetical protein
LQSGLAFQGRQLHRGSNRDTEVEHVKGTATGPQGDVLNAHLAVDGASGKYPEFRGNVATVYTHPMARGGSGNGHYGMDSRVYMDVGLAMGDAMLKLLQADPEESK